MYVHERNQNAHSKTGARFAGRGISSTPLLSSNSGTPPKWLASSVLIEVSVGVASVKHERREGG